LSSVNYYQNQRQKDLKAFLECQQAWEKYYSLNSNQTNQVVQPINSRNYNQAFWQILINGTLSIVQAKTKELITNRPFTLEQQKHLVYHYEVLPKCQKIKDWQKEASKLISKG
jgi:predicted transcriptional regulator